MGDEARVAASSSDVAGEKVGDGRADLAGVSFY